MTSNTGNRHTERGFFAGLLASLAHSFGVMLIAFLIGTGAAAVACWYYDLPLILSLGGGSLVLVLALVLMADASTF